MRSFTCRMTLAVLITGATCVLPGQWPSLLEAGRSPAPTAAHSPVLVRGRTRSQSPCLPAKTREAAGLIEGDPDPCDGAEGSSPLGPLSDPPRTSRPASPHLTRPFLSLRC